MIPNSELIFGPPGTGKTYTLIKEVEEALAKGIAPDRIGYVSFTKKAIHEAIERACSQFGLDQKQLPWFRTLHSWGFNGIGASSEDMMASEDWGVLGREVGMTFSGASRVNPDDGVLLPPEQEFQKGDSYIRMIDRARYRMIPVETEFNETEDWSKDFNILRRVQKEFALYKSKMNKIDFVDQIEVYIQSGNPPHLELLIIDEAQDLTPLQWEMVRMIAPNADRVIIAGDDDQAIHRWTGVDIRYFLECSSNVRVLSQSFRMPQKVHTLSQDVVKRIGLRREKIFHPTEEEGEIGWHYHPDELDLERGSWTLMARTNNLVRLWGDRLQEQGYLYSFKGHSSVNQKAAQAMEVWNRLQGGEGVEIGLVRELYKHVKKRGDDKVVKHGSAKLLDAAAPDACLTWDDLIEQYGMVAEKGRDAFEVARFGDEERLYIEALVRRGEDVTSKPRIKLSTFHSMKGGEDDNCAVYTSVPPICDLSNTKTPDDEHRCMYVGMTRSKQSLHIIDPPGRYKYEF